MGWGWNGDGDRTGWDGEGWGGLGWAGVGQDGMGPDRNLKMEPGL